MRKIALIAIAMTAGLGLAACSEKTEDAAEVTASSAANDLGAAADSVGDAVETGAAKVGEAADNAAAKTDEMGDKAADKAAEAEADLHNETKAEAKAD